MARLAPLLQRILETGVRTRIVPVIVRTTPGKELDLFNAVRQMLGGLSVEGVFSRLMLFSFREEFAVFRPRILSNFHMFSIPVTTPVLEDLAQSREVVKVYPDRMMYPLLPVADTGEVYADQRGKPFVTTKTVTRLLGAPDAWSKGYRGRGVNIAVIDTVALQQHQAIAKNILGGVPTSTIPGDYTDLNGHGVWVAAMAAGNQWVSPNGLETVGVAPEASLTLIKALGFVIGAGSDSSVIDAIGHAIARGAHIINMSLGSEQVPENLEDDPQAIAVKRATDAGILVMCAAGNSGPDPRTINSPGAVEEAITVGSYNPVTGKISDFSSVGPTPDGRLKPDVVAPGENVFGPAVGMLDFALPPRGVLRASVLSGTSMATPAAAGIAALMYESAWRQGVRLTPAMFKDMMARYGEFAGNKSNYYGWGVPTWDIWERYAREVIGISV